MNKTALFISLGLLLVGFSTRLPVYAQEAVLRTGVVSAGAGPSANADHRLNSTVGPFGVGTLGSTDHAVYGGFWAQVHPPAGAVAVPILVQDDVTTDEDAAVTFRPLDNDTDPAGGALTITRVTQPDSGTVEQATDDQLIYTPNPNFNGEDRFTYTATNAQGGSATVMVTVTVIPVNDAPLFTSDPPAGAAAGEEYTYVAEASDVDGDPLTFDAARIPNWISIEENRDGTALLQGTPTNADVGDHDVVLRATDGDAITEQRFTITVVAGPPNVPALTEPADGSEDVPLDVTLNWNGVPGAATYELQLAREEEFSATLIDTTGLTKTSLAVGSLAGGTTYFWRVRAVNGAGVSVYAGPFHFTTITNVATEQQEVPHQFRLEQNYPNPFNPTTTIGYELPTTVQVKLAVYDIFGREIVVLVNESQAAGRHEVSFAAEALASGVYLYQIQAGSFEATRHMLLIK